MKRNSIIPFVIALLAVIALVGGAQAAITVSQQVNVTLGEGVGEIATLWLDVDPSDYTTKAVQDGTGMTPELDYYYFDDISLMLDRNGYSTGDTSIPVTVAIYCSGTERNINEVPGSSYSNTYRNVTIAHGTVDYPVVGGTYYIPSSAMELEPCPAPPYKDLNVSEISVNPSCSGVKGGLFANETNTICAKIWNNGTAAAGQFNVSFATTGIPGGYYKEVTVPGLGAGNNTTVCITDCQPMGPTAIDAVTINVTADCKPEVPESDEGNNSMEISTTVYNNGYKGKTYTGGENISMVDTIFKGPIDLKYAVCNATTYVNDTGEHDFGVGQTYLSGSLHKNWTEYRARWDKNPQFSTLPNDVEPSDIKSAKLYVYYTGSYYSPFMPGQIPPDYGLDVNVSFNGMNYTTADVVNYSDTKGWTPSASGYYYTATGMMAYNVTSKFDNTTNTMVVYNLEEPGSATPPASRHRVTLQGAVLMVVYEHEDEPERLIYVNEGFDLLASTYYSCCTPAEATAYAHFNVGSDPLANATLITIATGATKDLNKLFFNNEEWDGGMKHGTFPTDEGWAPPAQTSYQEITANETDVFNFLKAGDNNASFQDSGDLFCMANAFLVLTKADEASVVNKHGDTVRFSTDNGDIVDLEAIDPDDVSWDDSISASFPYGLFSFNITGIDPIGATVNVTITLPNDGAKAIESYWKENTTPDDVLVTPRPSLPDNQIVIRLTDGGIGDSGAADGTIVDDGGPGTLTTVKIDPCNATIGADLTDRTTVNITLYNIANYGSGTINLHFDTTYVDVDSIGFGDSTNLHSQKITDGHYRISASNSSGISGNVTFANVTFKPMGLTTGCSDLDLVVDKLYDRNFVLLKNVTNSCEICITESNDPSVTNGTANPTRILNDNGRDRVQLPVSTNRSMLSVEVTDDTKVNSVTVNLTPILGAGNDYIPMVLTSGNNQSGTWFVETNATRDDGAFGLGINMTHKLVVTATDVYGNLDTNIVTLKVLRRGDVDPINVSIPQDNAVTILDYNEIAMYTVGKRTMPDEFTAGTVPADSWNGVDMADALYIALYTVVPDYPAP